MRYPCSARHAPCAAGWCALAPSFASFQAGLVERALQRLEVTLAGIGSPGDHVDLRTAGGQRFTVERRDGVGIDLLVARILTRVLDSGDVGELSVGHGDTHLDRTPPRVG